MDYGKRGRKVNSRRRLFLRLIGVFVLTVFLCLMISTERFVAFGGVPDEASLARIQASPHFDRTKNEFVNTEATGLMKVSGWESGKHWMFGDNGNRQVEGFLVPRSSYCVLGRWLRITAHFSVAF